MVTLPVIIKLAGASLFQHHRIATIPMALAFLLCLAACQPRITTHGFMPRNDLTAKLEPGKQDKNQVANILGSPTIIATFDQNVWYYITQTTENESFFKPNLVDQQILALTFDETGLLKSLETKSIVDAKRIEPHSGKTPTVGRKLSFFQQIFGNFGRFSNPASPAY